MILKVLLQLIGSVLLMCALLLTLAAVTPWA